jgi:hypothetical protein
MSLTRREAMTAMGGAVVATAWLPTAAAGDPTEFTLGVPDYSRQHSIKGLIVPKSATVIGAGKTGAWVALFAGMAGVKRLRVFDPATVARTDLPHSPFAAKQKGINKAKAVRETILTMRPKAGVEAYPRLFRLPRDAKLLQGVVFNATADESLHDGVAEASSNASLRYVSRAHNGMGTAIRNHSFSSLPMGRESGAWVGNAALSAILILYSGFSEPISRNRSDRDRLGSVVLFT